MTSMRRHYVASTSLRRHVPAGSLAPLASQYSKPFPPPPQYSKPSYAYMNGLFTIENNTFTTLLANFISFETEVSSQRAYGARMTSYRRRCDVTSTPTRHHPHVICPLSYFFFFLSRGIDRTKWPRNISDRLSAVKHSLSRATTSRPGPIRGTPHR